MEKKLEKNLLIVATDRDESLLAQFQAILLFHFDGIGERDLEKIQRIHNEYGWSLFQCYIRLRGHSCHSPINISVEIFTSSAKYQVEVIQNDFIKTICTSGKRVDMVIVLLSALFDFGEKQCLASFMHSIHLCRFAGIDHFTIVIHDVNRIQYDQDKFEALKQECSKLFSKTGVKPKRTQFIPISIKNGDNIRHLSSTMPWYKSDTISDVLESNNGSDSDAEMRLRKPFAMSIRGVHRIKGCGQVITGIIHHGSINANAKLVSYPSGTRFTALQIDHRHQTVAFAECDPNIGVLILRVWKRSKLASLKLPSVGEIAIIDDRNLYHQLPKQVFKFNAIVHFNTDLNISRSAEFCVTIAHRRKTRCGMGKIHWAKQSDSYKTGSIATYDWKENDSAKITFYPREPIIVYPFDVFETFGRILGYHGNSMMFYGKVTSCIHYVDIVVAYIHQYRALSVPSAIVGLIETFYIDLFF